MQPNPISITKATEPELAVEGRRYPLRQRQAPSRYPGRESVLLTNEGELECFEEVMSNAHIKEWYSAMQD